MREKRERERIEKSEEGEMEWRGKKARGEREGR